MRLDKPFWETKINPITGYIVENWDLLDERTLKIKKRWNLEECIILDDKS